jgi:hypothetical protein
MKDGGPAFPQGTVYVAGNQQMMNQGPQGGMSLRDYFAVAAVIGPIAELTGTAEEHAQIAYEYADAMLLERQKLQSEVK